MIAVYFAVPQLASIFRILHIHCYIPLARRRTLPLKLMSPELLGLDRALVYIMEQGVSRKLVAFVNGDILRFFFFPLVLEFELLNYEIWIIILLPR